MLNPTAAFFCDDVRMEFSGKLIFIGVYSGSMGVSQFPWAGRMCPVVHFDGALSGELAVTYRLSSEEGAVFGSGGFEVEAEGNTEARSSMLPFPPTRVTVSGPVVLQLWISIGEEPEVLAGELVISKGEDFSPQP